MLFSLGLAGVAGWTGYEKGKDDGRAEIIPQRDAETRRANAERQGRLTAEAELATERRTWDAERRRLMRERDEAIEKAKARELVETT